jgi:hypothetical protein
MSGTLESLFAFMDAQVGVTENPPHSNHVVLRNGKNLWVDYFGYQPPTVQAAWCALFQSACDWENGTPLPPVQFSKGFVGVDAGREWYRQHGLLVPDPKPGYLAFYHEHIGRVRRVTGPSFFDSLEGNEGDAVRVIHRTTADIVGGFGVRNYPSQSQEDDVLNAEEHDALLDTRNKISDLRQIALNEQPAYGTMVDLLSKISDKLDQVIANTNK